MSFPKGAWQGTVEEVRTNIGRYGSADVCHLIPSWFDGTMPTFTEAAGVGYVDVDLASSTRTCLNNLYARLIDGAILFSQDRHGPLVVDEIRGFAKQAGAKIVWLGQRKLVELRPPSIPRPLRLRTLPRFAVDFACRTLAVTLAVLRTEARSAVIAASHVVASAVAAPRALRLVSSPGPWTAGVAWTCSQFTGVATAEVLAWTTGARDTRSRSGG